MSDSDARDNCSDSNSRDSVLKSSRLNTPLRSSVLRPSLFASSLSNNDSNASLEKSTASAVLLEDSNSNPFLKDDPEQQQQQKQEEKNDQNNDKKDEKADEELKSDPLAMLSKNVLPRSNLFAATKNSIPRVEQTGFVFGQNVHERVTGAIENMQSTSSKRDNSRDDKQSGENNEGDSSKSETSGLLFSNAIQNNKIDDGGVSATPKENENKSLTEVAREYEESRAQKRKYEEVETFTGEENEVNILDINCKLFTFINRNWEERGRGSLRLNDPKDENGCSRVVFRTSGNLRLLVNTKVWSGMVAERASQKSLRLTAMDNTGQIKVLLIMSRPDDIATLYKALTKRINEVSKKIENISSSSNGENDKVEKEEIKINKDDVDKVCFKNLIKDVCGKNFKKAANDGDDNNDDKCLTKEQSKEMKQVDFTGKQRMMAEKGTVEKSNEHSEHENICTDEDEEYEPSPKKTIVTEEEN